MGNCQTKGATAVAERQAPPIDSRSYSIDFDGDDDESTIEDARLMVTKRSDEENGVVEQGQELNEHGNENLKPLELPELVESIATKSSSSNKNMEFGFGLISDNKMDGPTSTTQPQGRPGIPKAPTSTTSNGNTLHPSVPFPVMDELDALVASMSMDATEIAGDKVVEADADDDEGYVSSPSSSASSPHAIGGAMVPFSETPAPAVPPAVLPAAADDLETAGALVVASDTNAGSNTANESSSAIETQLALSASQTCAYALRKEEVEDAMPKSTTTQAVVAYQKDEQNAEIPTSKHFTFPDMKEEDQKRDCSVTPPVAAAMMHTPPSNPDKAFSPDLYLSPPTPENEVEEYATDGFLVALPFAQESAQVNNTQESAQVKTTDIVLHPTASLRNEGNYGEYISSAEITPVNEEEQHKTTNEKPSPSPETEVAPREENMNAIVEFTSNELVPVPDRTEQTDVLPESSNIELVDPAKTLAQAVDPSQDEFVHAFFDEDRDDAPVDDINAAVPATKEDSGGNPAKTLAQVVDPTPDKFVHAFSDEDRNDAPVGDIKASDQAKKEDSRDNYEMQVEEKIEVQLSTFGSLFTDAFASSAVNVNSEEREAIVEAKEPPSSAYSHDVELTLKSTTQRSKAANEKGLLIEQSLEEEGEIVQSESSEVQESGHGSGKMDEDDITQQGCVDAQLSSESSISSGHPPRPEAVQAEVNGGATATEKEAPGVPVDETPQRDRTPQLPTSSTGASGASVASMTHLSRRARNLRKNKSRAYTNNKSDDTDASSVVSAGFPSLVECRSADTECSDLHSDLYSVLSDVTQPKPAKIGASGFEGEFFKDRTGTEGSRGPTRGRASHIDRIRSRRNVNTVWRDRISERSATAPAEGKEQFGEGKPTTSPVNASCVLPPRAAVSNGSNDEPRYSTKVSRLAKSRRSRSRSVAKMRTASSSKVVEVEETKTEGEVTPPLSPTSRTSTQLVVAPKDDGEDEEKSTGTGNIAPVIDGRGRSPSRRTSGPTRTLCEQKAQSSAHNTDTVEEENTSGNIPPVSRRSLSRSRLSERKARSARMKVASQQTLSSAGSLESTPSIDSSTDASTENNASLYNTTAAGGDTMKTSGKMSSKENMKKKRLERARRLRAIQN